LTPRVYFVGTDTGVGKTTLVAALVRAAQRRGIRAFPFKPAASGPPGPAGDPELLLAAAQLSADELPGLAPLRYDTPIAPGLASDRARFLLADPPEPEHGVLASVQWALAKYEQRHEIALTLIEGAGGLLIPMPGGSWQDEWVQTLARNTIVVARAGLGTINHTLLTIDALRERGCPPLGFFVCQSRKHHDPSRADNVDVIEARAELPCLGRLPFLGRPPQPPEHDDWYVPDLWARLLRAR
jgi:dethiobiotin synthetase